jgi:Second Messenger Oligonucleotide or Dinucleotide Synthetase domain
LLVDSSAVFERKAESPEIAPPRSRAATIKLTPHYPSPVFAGTCTGARPSPFLAVMGDSSKKWLLPPPLSPNNALSSLLLGITRPSTSDPYTNALGTLAGGYLPSPGAALLGVAAPGSNALATLAGGALPLYPLSAPAPVEKWKYVRRRFSRFLDNLTITPGQREDAQTKQAGIRACLNRHYWGISSETLNALLIGSWGKGTQVRPPRDVDILFLLPASVYYRFQRRDGNRQSQLLQEVKDVLLGTYSQTTMRGDGQVIVIPFNSIPIELSPGFRCQDGSIIICDTNDGGRYRTSTAEVEELELSASDARWSGNTRSLARMLKQWQREHNVPLKSFLIERLALHFLETWPYSQHDVFWYDWMVRDFFAWLLRYVNGTVTMPTTREIIPLGSDWQVRAERAYQHAVTACENERDNYETLAGADWQKIFGTGIPVLVS